MAAAYQYDASGYFVGETDDYGGPLPNNATREAPEVQDGHIPRWTGAAWEQVENHKGREGYMGGEPFTVKEYGPLPEGWSDTPPPPSTMDEAMASAVAAIANRRWKAEVSGIAVQGMPIPTDRESQALITGAVAGALIDPAQVVRWKTSSTDDTGAPVFVDLDAATIRGVALAVRAHVQACFDLEGTKTAALAALAAAEASHAAEAGETPDTAVVTAWMDANLETGWPDCA